MGGPFCVHFASNHRLYAHCCRLQHVGIRFEIPDRHGMYGEYATAAVVSRDDGRMGFLIRCPEEGSHQAHY